MDINDFQQAVIFTIDDGIKNTQSSLDELKRLLDTAGAVCVDYFVQRSLIDAKTFIGKGKAEEIATYCKANGITLAVCDDELSPSQIKNLEDIMDGVEVIDRSMLILEIFKRHAVSAEGKLQVEIAQLRYTVPRLIGKGAQLSRQGGGGAGGGGARRGAGESKLETDKRHVRKRIEYLQQKLEEMEKTREVQRKGRKKSNTPCVAIAGYTNAGKSTLLNFLTDAGILAEDKLFATLDTTTRKYTLPDAKQILLTDTVGFIQRLPHHLIKAFRSTLEEVSYADIIILVCDVSDENCANELEVCERLLGELGAGDKPIIYVFNKCDLIESLPEGLAASKYRKGVKISAKTGFGAKELLLAIQAAVDSLAKEYLLLLPHSESGTVSKLYSECSVKSVEYTEEGIKVCAVLDDAHAAILKKYAVISNG